MHLPGVLARLVHMPVVLALLAALAACAGSAPPPVANQAAPAVRRVVIVRHALMTYVMDSPDGQRAKARAALESSALVAAIRERGYSVELRFDPTAGDDILVEADGRRIGHAPLYDIDHGALPPAILDAL